MRSWVFITALFITAPAFGRAHVEPPTAGDEVSYSNGWYYHRSSDGTVWRSRHRGHGWSAAQGRKIHKGVRHKRMKRARRHRHR